MLLSISGTWASESQTSQEGTHQANLPQHGQHIPSNPSLTASKGITFDAHGVVLTETELFDSLRDHTLDSAHEVPLYQEQASNSASQLTGTSEMIQPSLDKQEAPQAAEGESLIFLEQDVALLISSGEATELEADTATDLGTQVGAEAADTPVTLIEASSGVDTTASTSLESEIRVGAHPSEKTELEGAKVKAKPPPSTGTWKKVIAPILFII